MITYTNTPTGADATRTHERPSVHAQLRDAGVMAAAVRVKGNQTSLVVRSRS